MSISRIVGQIISFFMNQFLLVLYVLFLLAGLTCSVVSGLVEYQVFAGLFQKVGGNAPFYMSIAFFIVVALEITKVFLVFLHKQLSRTLNDGYISDRRTFTLLRSVLIITSAFCTLIYTFYNLHNPEYEKRLTEKVSQAEMDYQKHLTNIQNEFDQRLKEADRDVEYWKVQVAAEGQRVMNGIAEGPRYQAYEKKYDEAVKSRNALRAQLEQQRFQSVRGLEKRHEEKLWRLEEDLKSDRSSHNRLISATLQVINMGPNYPMWQYIVTIGLISGLLSIALESVIVCSFKVLAIYHGDVFELGIVRKNSEEKMRGLAETADDIHQVELDSFRKRVLREKENTVETLKDFANKAG